MTRMVRSAGPADAAAIAEIYRPYVTDSCVSFELEPPDEAEMARRVEKVIEWAPWLVCEVDGRVVGYAYASRHRERAAYQWSVEVSAYVRPEVQRGGIARLLYDELFAFLVRQGFYSAFAGITLPNDASVAFHLSMGFTLVGVFHKIGFKHGRWHDVGWYERALQAAGVPAAAPTALSALPS